MLSIDELMKPRIEIVAPWPICTKHSTLEPLSIGDVFQVNPDGSISKDSFTVLNVAKYPHLFKPLEWWRRREVSELPQYVRRSTGTIFKVDTWEIDEEGEPFMWLEKPIMKTKDWYPDSFDFLPATESEYQQYLNSKK